MSPVVERRTTVTSRSVRTEGADQLKASIANIADEIARVRDQARAEAGALDKIRGMLDTNHLDSLLRSIEELETRITTLESDASGAHSENAQLREALRQEQARLEKLWNAYKAQEDELNRVKRDYPLMEEKLFERERTIESLRRELARLEGLSRIKAEHEEALAENQHLRNELAALDPELRRSLETIKQLEGEVDGLRELEPARHRVTDLESQLEEERERLAKLYKVYEDMDGDAKRLKATIDSWNEWYRRVGPAIQTLCGAASEAPRGR